MQGGSGAETSKEEACSVGSDDAEVGRGSKGRGTEGKGGEGGRGGEGRGGGEGVS